MVSYVNICYLDCSGKVTLLSENYCVTYAKEMCAYQRACMENLSIFSMSWTHVMMMMMMMMVN